MYGSFGLLCNHAAGSIYRFRRPQVHMIVTGKRTKRRQKARPEMSITLPNLQSPSPIETALIRVGQLFRRLRDRNRAPRQERRSMNG